MLPTPPIHPLADAAGELASATGKLLACDDAIVFEDAVVVTPGNATLVHDLSLRVPLGTNLLVTGPNGAGKSSLFRWAWADCGLQFVLRRQGACVHVVTALAWLSVH